MCELKTYYTRQYVMLYGEDFEKLPEITGDIVTAAAA